MLSWLSVFLAPLQPYLPWVCFVMGWAFLLILAGSLWQLGREGLAVSQRMHQIPCSQCRFFSRDYRLKCALHPHQAATEAAISCPDFSL